MAQHAFTCLRPLQALVLPPSYATRLLQTSECAGITLLMVPSWLAPAPWRQVAFLTVGLLVMRYFSFVHKLLFNALDGVRVRHSAALSIAPKRIWQSPQLPVRMNVHVQK